MIAGPLPVRRLPRSSLILCTRNRFKLLADTLASILEANEVPDELIIIDQSDEKHFSLNQLANDKGCEVRYLWSPIIGSSHARNAGILAAKHDILAFVDDDMWVAPNWYSALIQALVEGGPRSIVTGRVETAPPEKPSGFVISVHGWDDHQIYQGRINKDVLATGLMAAYRSAFEALGGLDERLGPGTRFPGAEDNDFGFRCLEAGYKIIYQPDSVIYHRAWRTRRDYIPLFWRYGRGQGAFYAKHFKENGPYMRSRAKQDFVRYLRLLPERLWKGQFLVVAGSTAFILGEISGFLDWSITCRRK